MKLVKAGAAAQNANQIAAGILASLGTERGRCDGEQMTMLDKCRLQSDRIVCPEISDFDWGIAK